MHRSRASLSIRYAVLLAMMIACSCTPALSGLRQGGGENQQVTTGTIGTLSAVVQFAVVSIKVHNPSDPRWRLRFTPDGYSATGATADMLIHEAYGLADNVKVPGQPPWAESKKFDIEARVSDEDVQAFQRLTLEQRRLVLQKMLEQQFQLKSHYMSKVVPLYALTIASNGPRLHETPPDHVPHKTDIDHGGLVTRSRPGQLTVQWESMQYLAKLLSQELDRPVMDDTGLLGRYDVDLNWAPERSNAAFPAANVGGTLGLAEGPSLFTAITEQLGLALKSKKGPVQILVVDDIKQPPLN